MDPLTVGLITLWLLCAIAASAIGARKGEAIGAFIVGFIFGPFGILFAALSKGKRKHCPFCRELVHREASVCPSCQREQPD